jgi:hypothetical protein
VLTIPNVATQDTYTAACTIESQRGGGRLVYLVANASVIAQFRPLFDTGSAATQYHPEVLLTPSVGSVDACSGARFRSAVAGKPAQVVAQLSERGDVVPASGTPFLQNLQPTGGVSTTGVLDTETLTATTTVTTAATEAAPLTVITFVPLAFDGVTQVRIEWEWEDSSFAAAAAGNEFGLSLWDGSQDLGRCWHKAVGTTTVLGPISGFTLVTPPAGTTSYRLRAWAVTNSVNLVAGAGGAGTPRPAVARIATA